MRRTRVRVEGTVQGVGFRPHVFRLADELGLAGWVLNDEHGVLLEVEGQAEAIERFVARLVGEAPPLARVERVARSEVVAVGATGFTIAESASSGTPDAGVSADTATCADCLAEVMDPADRRHRYPFTNCTNCGPRFTIVRGVPYDRPLTTMAGFPMCAACRGEYEDPHDRRFHAQPNCCPVCGPALSLIRPGHERQSTRADAVSGACAALSDGLVVAVKGLGGFHLACRADSPDAVSALRARKHREDRPFALMTRDLDASRRLVVLSAADEEALVGRERPIVIARRQAAAPVAEAVAPRSPDLGVMLPYSALHHLLMDEVGCDLVMTSGNVSDEPIAYEDEDALARLAGIADLFLLHDRPIHMRTDDSVLRVAGGRRLTVRRSRGFVPDSLPLPAAVGAAPPLLACGAEQKSTFCVAKGGRAWVGHHIGDLKNYETLRSFASGVEHFERLFAVEPAVVAHDLHPDYLSTRYALEREGVEHVGVQHHHAHLAACLAEHDETGPAVGAIYDGTGHGLDGGVWGGELLVGGLATFTRAGSLWPVRLPGGDRAVREPWRMACAWLEAIGLADDGAPDAIAAAVDGDRWRAVASLARRGNSASPITTSMGRLFDAVAALCGVRAEVTYEGQAAVELEGLCDVGEPRAYPLPAGDDLVLDARETVACVARDVAAGEPVPTVAARFHRGVAVATAAACAAAAEANGLSMVVLSGGVFQNRVLLEWTEAELARRGLRVLVPVELPPNDGGIAYGQAAVAAARMSDLRDPLS